MAVMTEGTPVEVWSPFLVRWCTGFTVDARVDGGYLLRRLSDGAVLPAPFRQHALRRTRGGAGVRPVAGDRSAQVAV